MTSSKAKWENFFVQAGVPQRLSAEYAATFSSNRMRLDMVDELNKELLRDLGVKALGDIIGILRYAKEKQSSLRRSPSPKPSPMTIPQPRAQPRTQPRIQPRVQSAGTRLPSSAGPRLQSSSGPRQQSSLEKVKSKVSSVGPASPSPSQLKIVTTQKVNQMNTTQKVNQMKTKSASAMNTNNKPTKVNNAKNTMVLNASSALVTSKPGRQKLSERFDEFETEAKRKKVTDEGKIKIQTTASKIQTTASKIQTTASKIQTTASEIKHIRVGDRVKMRQVPEVKQTVAAPSLVAKNVKATDGKYIGIKVGDKIKLKAVPQNESQTDNKVAQTVPTKPTQFTVQVPSKQPTGIQDTSKNKQKITVVPAQGKALNRAKPLTSIFDRLDAPSSSSNALSLLNNDELKKDNVFKRLGTKSEDNGPKNQVAVGVVRPASTAARLGEKHAPDSVFNRLGDQNL